MNKQDALAGFLALQKAKENSRKGLSAIREAKRLRLRQALLTEHGFTEEDLWTIIREERNHEENA